MPSAVAIMPQFQCRVQAVALQLCEQSWYAVPFPTRSVKRAEYSCWCAPIAARLQRRETDTVFLDFQ